MPIIKSAKKKVRKDKRRAKINKKIRTNLKKAIAKAEQNPSKDTMKEASSLLDRAAKKKYIHKKKASRNKARLTRVLNKKSKPSTKKSPKK